LSGQFVIDNSVVMSWCFGDESSRYSNKILKALTSSRALVPGIWPLELTNVLLVAERKGRLDRASGVRFVELVRSLPIIVEIEPTSLIFTNIFSLARETGLSSYDASYLDLAMRAGLPIATKDKAMRQAAGRCGVDLLT